MTKSSARALLMLVAIVVATGCSPSKVALSDAKEDASLQADAHSLEATITRRDFEVAYRLDGMTASSPAVGIDVPGGLRIEPSVEDGKAVDAGEMLGRFVLAPQDRAALEARASESAIDRHRLEELTQAEGEIVAVSEGTVALTPEGLHIFNLGVDVLAPLSPIQVLRFQGLSFTAKASVETVLGRRTVTCVSTWSVDPRDEGDVANVAELGVEPIGAVLHCRVPRSIETALGLRAQLELRSAPIRDAVVVPNLLVGYDEEADGYFLHISQDGIESRLAITVGPTDGVVRVVTSEVPVGAKLLPPGE